MRVVVMDFFCKRNGGKKKTYRVRMRWRRGKRNLLGQVHVRSESFLLLLLIFQFKVTVSMPAANALTKLINGKLQQQYITKNLNMRLRLRLSLKNKNNTFPVLPTELLPHKRGTELSLIMISKLRVRERERERGRVLILAIDEVRFNFLSFFLFLLFYFLFLIFFDFVFLRDFPTRTHSLNSFVGQGCF